MSQPFVELMANYEPYDHTKDPYAVDAHGNKVQLIMPIQDGGIRDMTDEERFEMILNMPDSKLLEDITHEERRVLFCMSKNMYKSRIFEQTTKVQNFDTEHHNISLGYKKFIKESIKQKQKLNEMREWINLKYGRKYNFYKKYKISFGDHPRKIAVSPKGYEWNKSLLKKLISFKDSHDKEE